MINHEFAQLSKLMQDRQILSSRQPWRYLFRLSICLSGIGACAVLLARGYTCWTATMLCSTAVAVLLVQCIIVAHDAMHRQVFTGPRKNDVLALLIWNLLIGLSNSWFFAYHTKHHVQSNRVGRDPNLEHILVMPGRDDLESLGSGRRWFAKYQGYLLVPFLFLSGGDFLSRTFKFMAKMKKTRTFWIEVALLVIHYVVFLSFPFLVLDPAQAVVFTLWQYLLAGFYGGLIFATNHIGMPLVGTDEKVDFVQHQVSTSRNMTPHVLNNLIFAGLNYQIEHHLFPTVAYHKLNDARRIVQAHTAKRGIHYHEVGLLRTFAEMFIYLRDAGAPLRGASKAQVSRSAVEL
jgi:fatty acid desaturase